MNTINSISSHNLDTIEVIINIRPASRAINFRIRSLQTQARRELTSVPLFAYRHLHSWWRRSRSSTSSFNFLPEDPNKNARRLRRQTRKTRERPDARQVPVLQSFNQHPERNPFVHNEDDETCRGCVIETRSMCSRSNGALRKVEKIFESRFSQCSDRRSIFLLQSVLRCTKHIFLLWYMCASISNIHYLFSIIHYEKKKYIASVLIIPREWLRRYSWREFYRAN